MSKCLYCNAAFNDEAINPKTKKLYETCVQHRGSIPKQKIENEELRRLGLTKEELHHIYFFLNLQEYVNMNFKNL